MAEYDWDFNAAGYGGLAASDDVAQLLRAVVGLSQRCDADEAVPQACDGDDAVPRTHLAVALEATPEAASREPAPTVMASLEPLIEARPRAPEAASPPLRRRHGRALPA